MRIDGGRCGILTSYYVYNTIVTYYTRMAIFGLQERFSYVGPVLPLQEYWCLAIVFSSPRALRARLRHCLQKEKYTGLKTVERL